jgi:hypothetical protein
MKRAALTLFVLAPIFGEVLVGSTPPAAFLNPVGALYLLSLYGSAAVLIREVVRRRGLGWGSLLLLGAAYGLLEEGLVVNSLLNPLWPDLVFLNGAGRALGVNWIWTIAFAGYHAVISIAIPIVVTEAAFPNHAGRPWLGRLGLWLMAALLTLASLTGLALFGFLGFAKLGYPHPTASWFLILAITLALVVVALRWRPRPRLQAVKAPPGPWRLRLAGFGVITAWFVAVYVVGSKSPIGLVTVLAIVAVEGLAVLALWRWSARPGWGAPHRLALASGALGFFIALDPLIEFGSHPAGKVTTGITLVGLATLLGLVWLARRRPSQPPVAAPSGTLT